MTTREQATFCRICEPLCGMIATVKDDKLVSLRPDPDNVSSRGFACSKGIAYGQVQNDPERVTHPLRRKPDGGFERVSWDEAMADITARLKRIVEAHGGESVGWYAGNPAGFSYSHSIWMTGIVKALGTRHFYGAGSQDTNSRFAASALLYGGALTIPVPDLDATRLAVIVGANPAVSHGSLTSVPRFMDKLHRVVERGGRVVVIDPRRTETAHDFEWVSVAPDSDAFLLLSMAQVLFAEGLVDRRAVSQVATGLAALERVVVDFPPELTEAKTGVPAEQLRTLARDLAGSRALLYGRLGTCQGNSATLVSYLLDVVNLLAGNLDVAGGAVFGSGPLPLRKMMANSGQDSYDTWRTRIGSFPEVLGQAPTANMAAEIRTPGKGQLRALFVSAGNPVVSAPGGNRLESALDELELMVSLDLYVNETGAHADYILPVTAMYEREDFPAVFTMLMATPWIQATDAVVPPAGEARQEWEIIDELARALGTRALPTRGARRTAKLAEFLGLRFTPRRLIDLLIRLSTVGDRFGLRRSGINFTTLLSRHPHGLRISDKSTPDMLPSVITHADKMMHLDQPSIWGEVERLSERRDDAEYPLRLIGMREPRSENSWMHNVPALRAARPRHAARMHPDDAVALGLVHGGDARLVSRWGAIKLPVLLTEDIARGVVAVPHGWGHSGKGKWSRANREGGVSVNDLMSVDPSDIEPLAGMSHLSGVRVRAEAIVPRNLLAEV